MRHRAAFPERSHRAKPSPRGLRSSAKVRVVAIEALHRLVGLRVGQHVRVEIEFKLASAQRCHLAEHDVLGYTAHLVDLRVHGRLHQDLYRLLE